MGGGMIQPYVHLYNKPKQQVSNGLQFIQRYPVFGYKHQIDAMGWFDSMRCEIPVTKYEGENFIQDYLGNEVRVYFDNPNRIAWEGFINRISLRRGGIVTTRSLDNMTNRVQVLYDNPAATPQQTRSTEITNDDSISVYGSKTGIFEAGTQRGAQTLTTGIGAKKLAQLAWPAMSSAIDTSGNISLEIECLGFYHTLEWDKFVVGNPTVEAVGLVVARYLYGSSGSPLTGYNSSNTSGNGNGLFYVDTDSSLWNANTSYNAIRENRSSTIWEKLVKMTEAGDGSDDWLVGIAPTDNNLGYRRAYYREANTSVKYVTYLRDGLQIRTPYGNIVQPWEVEPDGKIRIADLSIFSRRRFSTEPSLRTMWIKKISYDAAK